jgi:hypothetical protein
LVTPARAKGLGMVGLAADALPRDLRELARRRTA